ncbi:MAG: hypothetical protein INR72_20485 [Williamsia herbipolensis]|nr:hypothetical protein [Williamsia herbipolensis]
MTGTTTPGARVDVSSIGTDDNSSAVRPTRADGSGAFRVAVPVGFGADTITALATTRSGTGYAQVGVTGELVGGTSVLDVTDPSGDDHGPGTFTYPTAADFHDGAFDITRFQVLTKNGTVYLRTTLRDLTPTFGSNNGAQLLDLFVRDPGAAQTSTAAPYASRNYTLAQPWSQRIEVQGFAAPVWQDASGTQPGAVTTVVASPATRTITVALPADAFGTPTSGWTFAVTLHGQDGFSSDQARGFQTVAQDYQFGLCPAGGTAPVCSIDPGTAPKVMDAVLPAGSDPAVVLDPTDGPVRVPAVTVP